MLLFGHVGLTTGLALGIDAASRKLRPARVTAAVSETTDCANGAFERTPRSFLSFFDLRVIMIGSLLPDIIDKPIGNLIFRDYFYSNGRIFAHTLLFLVLVTLSGYILYRMKKQTWLLALACGTFTHLIFDMMWRTPTTLFWPFLGTTFPRSTVIPFSAWIQSMWNEVFKRPVAIAAIPEAIGFLIVAGLGVYLVRKGQLGRFIRSGKIYE